MNRVKCETKNNALRKRIRVCVCVCACIRSKKATQLDVLICLFKRAVHEPQVRWNLTNKFHPKILSSFRMHIQRLLSYTGHLTLSPETYRNQLSFTTLDPCSLRASNLFVSLYYILLQNFAAKNNQVECIILSEEYLRILFYLLSFLLL